MSSEPSKASEQPSAPTAETEQSGDEMRYLSEADLQQPVVRTGRGIAWLTLLYSLLLTGALVAVGYWLYPQWQQLNEGQQRQQQALERQLDEERSGLQRSQQQLRDEQQRQLEQWQQQQRQQQDELRRQLQQQQTQFQQQLRFIEQRLEQQQGAAPSIWLLAEVDYLLRMASQKIWLELDVATSLQLLKSADSRLARLGEPALLSVREAIRQDEQALSRLRIPDPAETQLTIRSLRELARELPFKDQQQTLQGQSEPTDAGWRERGLRLWRQGLQQLVQVRRSVAEDNFSLSREQQFLLRQRLQQQLVQAELAAMQQQSALFQASLREAADLVQRYFEASDAGTQQLSARLVELARLELHPGYIAPLQSLEALQRYQRTIQLLGEDAGDEL
ncbi:uroporphyrinogen-III C-methyltransferase [Alkalimonas amylolytica]|uniref:Uroporphyrin-3 C-methyltransferase n=1 Tax=Alkalimonas amylolytica TaxID=152573 RepID=A0A1H4EGZ2_ALKAM|nr:uroporphyrinogen-III C-methyltransferase [Alkalimonas amylolytica]SEA84109.1 uroporphyrin-3 C-methyltransferase [Alkalimonas amylolytica]